MIEGKHLMKATTVDLKTGKETPNTTAKMMMLPAREGTCAECAVAHDEKMPHNAQSMFYQYKFYNEHGRWPNWKDAMAHCSDEMKASWTEHLKKAGVDVEGGRVNPDSHGAGAKKKAADVPAGNETRARKTAKSNAGVRSGASAGRRSDGKSGRGSKKGVHGEQK